MHPVRVTLAFLLGYATMRSWQLRHRQGSIIILVLIMKVVNVQDGEMQ